MRKSVLYCGTDVNLKFDRADSLLPGNPDWLLRFYKVLCMAIWGIPSSS
ncbi:Uncharacterised protein [Legionella pneumophila]|nr:Uncharacterised protein [Legionella pneumophila]CZH04270.1 Uncharacterised protein [Legionella pneumophila]CZH55502.1 Uncharacterised protein [Legionella pneumophila]CZH95505.1 Uncharacterised protein [Legionella pneumophila]CZI03210.1 Uncharacterised protein [Legionella pneumophila]